MAEPYHKTIVGQLCLSYRIEWFIQARFIILPFYVYGQTNIVYSISGLKALSFSSARKSVTPKLTNQNSKPSTGGHIHRVSGSPWPPLSCLLIGGGFFFFIFIFYIIHTFSSCVFFYILIYFHNATIPNQSSWTLPTIFCHYFNRNDSSD